MLSNITIAINFVGLMAALWLGLFLVTRRSDRPEAWLSALGLWSMGGYFLNQLLALLPPPPPGLEVRVWLYHLILFWPRNVFEMGWKGWLLGWLPAYSIFFWHHASLYILPSTYTRKRLFGAGLGYAAALAGILVNARYSVYWASIMEDPLYNPAISFPVFPLYTVAFAVVAGVIVYNLARTTLSSPDAMPRNRFWLFVSALLLVGANSVLRLVSTLLDTSIPQVFTALIYLTVILLAGIGIAGLIPLPDLRSGQNDLRYMAIGAAVLLGISFLLLWVFSKSSPLSTISYVLVGCLAVISSFVIDFARSKLSRKNIYGEGDRLLQQTREPDRLMQIEEIKNLPASSEETSLSQVSEQPVKTMDISARTVELALRNLNDYAYLADSPLASLHQVSQSIDFLEKGNITYIERGRAVSDILCDAVQMLRPSQGDMPNPPPRTWYPYIILWDAYINNKPNLVIMSRLYISEGTFNRTRKAAISSVARLLMEMEARSR